MTRCRHRRIRWLPLTTLAAALLILAAGTGVRVGTTVGTLDARAHTTCEAR